jgi:hypothetical protein
MDDVSGAAPTKRCPACDQHKTPEEYSPAARNKPGSYCRECRTAATREWRKTRVYGIPLPTAELIRLRAQVACMVCGAIPKPHLVGGKKRVHTAHAKGCSAQETKIRKTG